ncbi:hypothetical protein EV200_108203 [Pedobacter psychrotolerans]|nr:hypothetical protein EV200_108203 [Pedobacter psychrotolerans]
MNYRNSRANKLLLSYEQSFNALKNNLINCNKVEQREYINRRGESQFYLEFEFPNGKVTQSVESTQEVRQLLNDFLHAEGVFKRNNPDESGDSVTA